MPDAFDHCADLVRAVDKDRYLSALFAPAKHRGALYALYAFNSEIARVRDLAREPMPGEIRLQWWREQLADLRAGGAGAAPVAKALSGTIARYHLPLPKLTDLIEARSFDLYDDPIRSVAELEDYSVRTSSSLMVLAAQILNDGRDPDLAVITRHAGIAYAVAGLLEALAVHARRRQLYLPLELLQRHGACAEDVHAGTATQPLRAALADMRKLALRHLSQLTGVIAAMPVTLIPAILPAALVRPVLHRMERADPFALRPLPQWRRQLLLLAAAHYPRRIAG
jgi:phytoene synthase